MDCDIMGQIASLAHDIEQVREKIGREHLTEDRVRLRQLLAELDELLATIPKEVKNV